jgi:hypothetical protein
MLQDLRDAIGTSGRVEEEYGGYQITIQDLECFPWYDLQHAFGLIIVRSMARKYSLK